MFEIRGERLPGGAERPFARPFVYESAFRWRLRRGRVAEHQGFFDTNALIKQTR